LNTRQLSTVPSVIDDIINGRHDVYVKQQLDNYFGGPHTQATGMRFSVMCAEHLAYSDTALTARQHQLLPWLAGLRYNNVNHAICDCWKVKKAPASAKLPLYSSIPALITAGDIDPWCRPFYNRLIKRGMSNSQLLLFRRRGHMPGFFIAGTDYLELFMRHPFNEIVSTSNDLIIE
ncbi:MAG TPA: alpha/beta hydrolase, partial [Chitinophaga sp.]